MTLKIKKENQEQKHKMNLTKQHIGSKKSSMGSENSN
jgi:hypothetical protein